MWPLESTSSRNYLGHLISHSWGHFPGVEAGEATIVQFRPLQVTGPGGDPRRSGLSELRVQQVGAEPSLARRNGSGAAQGRGPLGGSRQSAGDTGKSWGSGGGALQRGPARREGRIGGLPSRSREHPQRRKRRCQGRRRRGSD